MPVVNNEQRSNKNEGVQDIVEIDGAVMICNKDASIEGRIVAVFVCVITYEHHFPCKNLHPYDGETVENNLQNFNIVYIKAHHY